MTSLLERQLSPPAIAVSSSSTSTFRDRGYRPVSVYVVVLALILMLNANQQLSFHAGVMNMIPAEEKVTEHEKLPSRQKVKENYSKIRKDVTMADHVITHISNGDVTNVPIIPVVVWPYLEFGVGNAVSQHLEENGVNESTYLELSDDMWNFDPNVVWVGDIGYGPKEWCDSYHKKVVEAIEKRSQLGLTLQWPVFIVDWGDGDTKRRCKHIEDELGPEFVQYSKRSLVTGRKWNDKADWVKVGHRSNDNDVSYRPMPYFVRTDTIETMQDALREQHNMTLASPIEMLDRKTDVSHFWPVDLKGVGGVHSKLRQKVSRIIVEMGDSSNLNVFVGLAGSAHKEGRRGVQSVYIEAMLETKIIVVTQRDNWEDHYRLFEALISGAMVMTDRMLLLPQGLDNGTSVIEFDSADDLRSKIMYFTSHQEERLAIARKGREVSMNQHRSWHRIEEVIFGKAISGCSRKKLASGCPWIVHASEA